MRFGILSKHYDCYYHTGEMSDACTILFVLLFVDPSTCARFNSKTCLRTNNCCSTQRNYISGTGNMQSNNVHSKKRNALPRSAGTYYALQRQQVAFKDEIGEHTI